MNNYMSEIRHQIHQYPELAYNELKTSELVAKELESMGYDVQRGIGKTGVTTVLDSGRPGLTIALRADMDALPLIEKTDLTYASKNHGKMHACGHDGHTATLLGVAKRLQENKDKLCGKIKLIFQPAEEQHAGAKKMIEDGVLQNPKVDCIFGYHNWPGVATATLAVKSGVQLANTNEIKIILKGRGGHAALPHLSDDLILAGSQLVQSIHALMGRWKDPVEPAVLSITQFESGFETYNVLPEQIILRGTLRSVSKTLLAKVETQLRQLIKAFQISANLEASLEMIAGYPATINTKRETEFVKQIGREVLGEKSIMPLESPSMGGEDFSYYLQEIPGCYFFLGNGLECPSLHNPHYDYNDELLQSACDMMYSIAINASERLQQV